VVSSPDYKAPNDLKIINNEMERPWPTRQGMLASAATQGSGGAFELSFYYFSRLKLRTLGKLLNLSH
jgi:hypothetical protein